MTRETFECISGICAPFLQKEDTRFRQAITLHKRVAVGLYWLYLFTNVLLLAYIGYTSSQTCCCWLILAIPLHKRVAVGLYWLANGGSQKKAGVPFGVFFTLLRKKL